MTAEEAKAIVDGFFTEVWLRKDLAQLEKLADDVVVHNVDAVARGREAWKRTFLPFFEGFPDLELSIEFMVAEGDMVALRWTATGTHDGEFRGIPATGRRINVTGIAVYRVSGGRIVEIWSQPDLLGLLRQIGAVAEPQRTGRAP